MVGVRMRAFRLYPALFIQLRPALLFFFLRSSFSLL